MQATKRNFSVGKLKAFTLIEVLLAIVIFTISSIAVVSLSIDTLNRDVKTELSNEALHYAQEGIEATRAIRSENYWDLVTGEYGLSFVGDTWSFTSAPEVIDAFYERTIFIEDVYRDGSNNIAATGTLDPNTKKIRSVVSWSARGILPKQTELDTYLSNWTGDSWLQETCTDWNAGTFNDTQTIITPAPPDDNCAIMLQVVTGPGSFFSSANVGSHGNDVDVDGNYAYMATGKSEEGLVIIDITDIQNPVEKEEADIQGKGRGVIKDGNYAYVGVEKSTKGFAIVNVSNPSNPSLKSTLNVGGYGNRLDKSGNYIFLGVESSSNSMKVINVSNPSSPSVSATLNLGTSVNVVKINGNYAYLGTDDTSGGLRVVDISNPLAPTQVATLNLGGAVAGIDISGMYAYVGLLNTSNSLKIIDISNPLSPSLAGTYDPGAKVQDVRVDGDYAYIALDQVSPGMSAIDITNTPTVSLAYTRDIRGKGTSVETSNGYIFMTTDVSNMGLIILDVSSGSLATLGDYTSNILDTGSEDIRYNYFSANTTVAPGGAISFQIRTASTSGGINSATWVGPDGTAASTYSGSPTAIVLSPTASGKRYAQVKATITSDLTNSSEIESITINYTP